MNIADDLRGQSWSVQENYFDENLIAALREDLATLQQAGMLRAAAVGRAQDRAQRADIRNDQTLWLAGQGTAQQDYLRRMDDLRADLNRTLFLGLNGFEAHYAVYDAGGFYKKHVDSFRGRKNRVVSTVTYLTPGWQESDGGHLVLYHPQDEDREMTRILPRAGTLAVFMSEEIPHEVLPPARPRASIAGWLRCDNLLVQQPS